MLNRLRKRLVAVPRTGKRALMLGFDSIAIAFAIWAAIAIRRGSWAFDFLPMLPVAVVVAVISLAIFIRLGMYRAIIRFLGIDAFYAVLKGITLSTLVLAAMILLLGVPSFPRSSLFIYWLLAGMLIGGSRFLARDFMLASGRGNGSGKEPALIYGAGAAGHQLSQLMSHNPEIRLVGFLDDDPTLHGNRINGLPVYPSEQLAELIEEHTIQRILLALPNASHAQRKQIVDRLEPFPVHVYTVPTIEEIISGKARVDEIREVEIDDLLGRDPVPPNHALLHACIRGKNVMVTGAGGSIGSELCRQIITLEPKRLILLDASEYALYQIERELLGQADGPLPPINALLGNVQDKAHMAHIMRHFKIHTVYHAAAYKHVPIVEHNIMQGIRNNIHGTLATAQAAIDSGAETFLLISTDKAVRPTNVMGASKRFAELILQALAKQQTTTRLCMVRFGNVLGSSGSVIPLFREQIKNGGPITVTHPDIIRYFMTIPEAAQLVIQAGSMGTGGDVFVLDMGQPVKIDDLAKKMIRLMGKTVRDEHNPNGDIAIEYTGLRPGEKLYEELLIGDNVIGTEHAMIMRAEERALNWEEVNAYLDKIEISLNDSDTARLRELLHEAVDGYQPNGPLVDHLHCLIKAKSEIQQLH